MSLQNSSPIWHKIMLISGERGGSCATFNASAVLLNVYVRNNNNNIYSNCYCF